MLPGHSETVGEAFIRILADGSGLDRSIRDEFKGHDDAFREQGRQSHEAYREGFEEEEKKHPFIQSAVGRGLSNKDRNILERSARASVRDLNAAMRRDKGKFDATGQFLASAMAQRFRKTITDEVGSKQLGDRIFRNISKAAFQSGDLDVFERRIKHLGREIPLALEQIRREELKATRQQQDQDRNRVREVDRLGKEIERLAKARFDAIDKLSSGVAKRDQDRVRNLLNDTERDGNKIEGLLTRARRGDADALSRLESVRRESAKLIQEGEHGFLRLDGRIKQSVRDMTDSERHLARLETRTKRIADDVGKVFGAGSRNNFFNALGLLTGGLTRLTLFGFVRGRRALSDFVNDVRHAPTVMTSLEAVFGNVTRALGKLALAPIAVFGGLSALLVVIGPLAAAVSLLAGAITALVGTIAIGLVGALSAVLPILGVVAVGVGTAALAFSHLNKAQRDLLKKRLKPVIADFKELRNVARGNFFSELPKQVPLLHRFLNRSAIPLVRAASKSMAESITHILGVLDGPVARKNLQVLTKFIPKAGKDLGIIFGNVFNQIGGFLRAATPIAQKFLDSLVKSSAKWSQFINSTRGQNRLSAFLDRAYNSARRLYRFVRDLFKVIKDLLLAGEPTGDTLFDSMNRGLERFDRFLRSPEGRRALRQWFDDSVKFVHALGGALAGIGKLFGALDNPATRKELDGLLQLIGGLAGLVAKALPGVIEAFVIFGKALKSIGDFLGGHSNLFKPLITSITLLWLTSKLFTGIGALFAGMVGGFGLGTERALTAIGRLQRGLTGLVLAFGISSQANAVGTAVRGKGNKPTIGSGLATLGTDIGGLGVGGALIGSAFGPGGTAIGALAGTVAGAVKGIIDVFHQEGSASREAAAQAVAALDRQRAKALLTKAAIQDLTSAIEEDSNALGTNTKQQIRNDLQKSGSLNLALQAGLNLKDVVKAQLGNVAANRRVFLGISSAANSGLITPAQRDKLLNSLLTETSRLHSAAAAADIMAIANGKLNLTQRSAATEATRVGLSLTGQSDAAVLNRRFIEDNVDSMKRWAARQIAAGKSVTSVTKGLHQQVDAFRKHLIAAGFDRKAVDGLLDVLVATAKTKVNPAIRVQVAQAISQVLDVQRRIRILRDDAKAHPTHVGLDDALIKIAQNQLADLKVKIFNLTHPNHQVRVGADTSQANSKLDTLAAKLRAMQAFNLVVRANVGDANNTATGGTFWMAQIRRIAEAGPEAVVPLRRPLSQVDPSVRALSAFAQGLDIPNTARGGVFSGPRKVINVESGAIQIVAPLTDPFAAAQLVLDNAATIGGYEA